uniref:Root meristem growth factor 1 n=2 Tax=Nicotiana TaxID=4085 RepID=A0A1S4CW70_TOBAC|nr:PREDICTED: root meristem growth factor 1 isoform X2 [Nicotiana sylvestris]XP_016505361.1 PREDICTED: root meristem growth factor 1-like [Nicotiana tabacum]
MLPIRILCLLVLLILIAHILPSTSSYQGDLSIGRGANKRRNSAPNREANTGGEHEAAVIRGNKMKGSQKAYTGKFMKEDINIVATKQERVGLNVNVKGEQIMSRRPLSQSGGKKERAEFVAFTADYKSPRHHPPRHN